MIYTNIYILNQLFNSSPKILLACLVNPDQISHLVSERGWWWTSRWLQGSLPKPNKLGRTS